MSQCLRFWVWLWNLSLNTDGKITFTTIFLTLLEHYAINSFSTRAWKLSDFCFNGFGLSLLSKSLYWSLPILIITLNTLSSPFSLVWCKFFLMFIITDKILPGEGVSYKQGSCILQWTHSRALIYDSSGYPHSQQEVIEGLLLEKHEVRHTIGCLL